MYLFVVTLAFFLVPSLWTEQESRKTQPPPQRSSEVEVQSFIDHQIEFDSPGILIFTHQPELKDIYKQKTRHTSFLEKPIAEFNFSEIREKFEKMAETEEFIPYPDPPPPINTNEEFNIKLKNIDDSDPSKGKGYVSDMKHLNHHVSTDRPIKSNISTLHQSIHFFNHASPLQRENVRVEADTAR